MGAQLIVAAIALGLVALYAEPLAKMLSRFFIDYPLLRHLTRSPEQARLRPAFLRLAAAAVFVGLCANTFVARAEAFAGYSPKLKVEEVLRIAQAYVDEHELGDEGFRPGPAEFDRHERRWTVGFLWKAYRVPKGSTFFEGANFSIIVNDDDSRDVKLESGV